MMAALSPWLFWSALVVVVGVGLTVGAACIGGARLTRVAEERLCFLRTRHSHELMLSAGERSVRMECCGCGRTRVMDLDTGQRPYSGVPVRHSLAPRLSDRWRK